VLKAEQNKVEAVSGATVEFEAVGASIAPAVAAPVEKLVKVENTVSTHETPVVAETKTEDMSEPTETAQVDTPVLTETEKMPTPGDAAEVEKTVVTGVLTTVAQSEAPSPSPVPDPSPVPVCVVKPVAVIDPIAVEDLVAEHMASLTITTTETAAETEAESESGPPNSDPVAASSGEQPVTAPPADASLAAAAESKDVPASSSAIPDDGDDTESESAPSDIEIPGDDDVTRAAAPTDKVKVSQSNGVECSISVTSNLAVKVSVGETPVGIDTKPPVEVSEGNSVPPSDAPVSEATGGVNGEASVEVTAGAYSTVASATNLNVVPPQPQPDSQATLAAEPTKEALQAVEPAEPAPRAVDCVKEIRDLVVAVFEVEEVIQRYPYEGGVASEVPDITQRINEDKDPIL
jgi:hypothetical protein